ncbi:MAG: PP2C family serine/threonine-protein phosphatase [Terriglobales bacterium]
MKVRSGVEVSGQSDIGCLRQNNEDSFGYWEPEDDEQFLRKGRLAVVADGMGGYEGGQEASRLAVETLVAVYRDFAGDDPQAALNEALQAAHEQIRQYSFAHPELRGMGTTCTAAAIVRATLRPSDGAQNGAENAVASELGKDLAHNLADYDALYYVHVGDTRLYLIRDGQITRVTRDHSYVGRLVEAGMISPEEAEHHPQRNILTAALGTNPDLIMDSPGRPEPLRPHDVLLICSDGLWGLVHDSEILAAVENKSAEQAGRELIKLARERGGPDNITVEILRLR